MKTVKVKILVSRASNDGACSPGDVIEVPENEAPHMVAAGQCEIIGKMPRGGVVERAVPGDASEKAAI